ncbi:DNA integrity scanning diadenylate cyclase DisA [Natranaerobius thermophilus JW/NM-WN-LF]|nr:DNA integrity scanning diadenylate cyclase DisA [Natranaerobius thermophilus]
MTYLSKLHDNKEFLDTLAMLAPGTGLRAGLENVLRAKTGGLIVLGDNEEVRELITGGFKIDATFSPSNMYELAKMDGALVLSSDARKIVYANVHLNPDSNISSSETGIRHRTAERVAKQTQKTVVAISQRRNIITIYHNNWKYAMSDIGVILTKANQAVQTLDKYRSVLDQDLTNLSALEFEESVTLADVVKVIQRSEMVMRIVKEIEKYITELGTEGRLVKMQLDELIVNVEDDSYLLIKDYYNSEGHYSPAEISNKISEIESDELLEPEKILEALGYPKKASYLDQKVMSRGFRILNKIPRLPINIVENVVERFGDLRGILNASIEELDDVEGIGEIRARVIKDGLRRIREQALIDRYV